MCGDGTTPASTASIVHSVGPSSTCLAPTSNNLMRPPGLMIQALENSSDEWSLRPSPATGDYDVMGGRPSNSRFRGEELMIQALTDETFVKVCLDSGAGESVCPWTLFQVTR